MKTSTHKIKKLTFKKLTPPGLHAALMSRAMKKMKVPMPPEDHLPSLLSTPSNHPRNTSPYSEPTQGERSDHLFPKFPSEKALNG